MAAAIGKPARWYQSFYWRIGLSFVVLVVAVLLAQSVVFNLAMQRSIPPFPGRSPNNVAAIVAADLGSAMTQDPELDLKRHLDTQQGNAVVLSVSDSGGGIAPEHLPHVFERFYRVDAARTHGSHGSGLGLSIAKAIVESHGGTMEVASVPGRTVFTIVLPRPAVDIAGGADRPPAQATSTNLSPTPQAVRIGPYRPPPQLFQLFPIRQAHRRWRTGFLCV